jgi:DNA-binding FrmR family transcriptional regulator
VKDETSKILLKLISGQLLTIKKMVNEWDGDVEGISDTLNIVITDVDKLHNLIEKEGARE